MPKIKQAVWVTFEVWCGICGAGCCFDTKVKKDQVTVTCKGCEGELKLLRSENKKLQKLNGSK
jgi:uncharacterized protein (DUF983 family)